MENQSQPPTFPEAPKEPADVQPSKQSNAGLWTLILGLFFAFSPVFLASTSTPDALWFLMATIPIGGTVAIIGLVMLISSSSKK